MKDRTKDLESVYKGRGSMRHRNGCLYPRREDYRGGIWVPKKGRSLQNLMAKRC